MVVRIVTLLLLFVGAVSSAPVDSTILREFDAKINEHRQRTDSIRNLIDSSEIQLTILQTQESEQLTLLNEIEKMAAVSQGYIDSLGSEMTLVQDTIVQLTSILDSLELRQQKRKELMNERLRKMYAMGRPSLLSIVVGASSPQDMVQRVAVMQQLSAYDQRLMLKIQEAKDEILFQQEVLQSNEAYLAELVAERQQQNEQLQQSLLSRKELLTSIQSEKERWQSAVEELQVAQEELSALIVSLVSKRKKLSVELERSKKMAFEKRKGHLMWPVDGPVLVPFGKITHPIYKTVTISKGVVIGAPKGRIVRNVAPATVVYVGRMRGYGQIVVMDNGGGYSTVYTHLDKVSVTMGELISVGSAIGTVGESGSLDGSKLRFEIRDATGALDPQEWLESKDATP